ncbi:unnamed protein product [Trypanosoma congolense IL3000]|uniref:WGS project CAEQ00000000 data, annotated contig 1730 n=2 Tax=Trypanosoma congolense (strain IL3000) TaxID=1068625 RepID=F9W8D4_TRYCI|nr:unnamed protein product [Trypanosoma congolense IL3000]
MLYAYAREDTVETMSNCGVTSELHAAHCEGACVRPVCAGHGGCVWTLDSTVEEVLLWKYGNVTEAHLHKFLLDHFGSTFGLPDMSLIAFMNDPSLFVTDTQVLSGITSSAAYVDLQAMLRAVNVLNSAGIITLEQWSALSDAPAVVERAAATATSGTA